MTIPRSQQYIRVKKNTGVDPDPALFCPPRGYYKEDGYIPDPDWLETPDAEAEEIILLCYNGLDSQIRFLVNVNTGIFAWEVYGAGGGLIDSGTSASTASFIYTFTTGGEPHPDDYSTFIVKFKSVSGNVFTRFDRAIATGLAATGWPVLEAKINAPNLTTFTLQNQRQLQYAWMCSQMNSLVNNSAAAYYAFQFTHNLKEVVLPTQMNSLTYMISWFTESFVPKVDLPDSLPECLSMGSIFSYSRVKKVKWPTSLPKLTNIGGAISYSKVENLELPVMPELLSANMIAREARELNKVSLPSSLLACNTGYWEFNYNDNLSGEITMPARPLLVGTGLSFSLSYSKKVSKITYLGTADLVTDNRVANDNTGLLEVVLPTSMNGITAVPILSGCSVLKKITLPLSMTSLTGTEVFSNVPFANSPAIAELSTCNNWGTNVFRLSLVYMPRFVKIFNQPTLRLSEIVNTTTATSGRYLEYFEIAWGYITGSVNFRYCQFSASEINRMFAALPAITATINVMNNPGSAGCDPSIATSKGWTVQR